MSDFDKEAEREKLREQFAEDESGREHTERMSELLLQGATMTNKHCDTCGDPVFRHEGQEFCPTCNTAEGQQAAQEQAAQQEDQTREPTERQPETAEQPPMREVGSLPDAEQQPPATGDQGPTTDGETLPTDGQHPPEQQSRQRPSQRQPTRQRGDDLSEARGALTRTVTRLARQAEASDDLGRTRDCLAGAKEAAEALAAVRNAER